MFHCADVPVHPQKLTEMRVWPLSTSVEVSWTPPDHGNVRGYRIGYGISVPDVYSLEVNASVLHYIIRDLGQSWGIFCDARCEQIVLKSLHIYGKTCQKSKDKSIV
jgi:hypothetical protein